MSEINFDELKEKAKEIRRGILKLTNAAGSGHPGGSLSAVEIFLSLYEYQMNYKADDPQWVDRDYLVVSKGHVSPVTYVTLAEFGFFPKEELETFRKYKTRLQGHVVRETPGVEFNTGSLGHGLSVANGIALGAKMRKSGAKAYCIMGDGEVQEGSVWEAAMTAAHYNIDNVCAIVDYNKVQQNDLTNTIKNLEPLDEKWRSFGWNVARIEGNDLEQVKGAFDQFNKNEGKPFCIIADTKKGNGISFMELNPAWHGVAPNDEQLKEALAELE